MHEKHGEVCAARRRAAHTSRARFAPRVGPESTVDTCKGGIAGQEEPVSHDSVRTWIITLYRSMNECTASDQCTCEQTSSRCANVLCSKNRARPTREASLRAARRTRRARGACTSMRSICWVPQAMTKSSPSHSGQPRRLRYCAQRGKARRS